MKVPPFMNTIPLAEVSPLNFNEESTGVAENLAGTIIQDVAESFFASIVVAFLF
jgi:hypothetical protein